MKKDVRIWSRCFPVLCAGKIVPNFSKTEVRVMAVAEGHAMVRRPGATPFIVALKELSPKANK